MLTGVQFWWRHNIPKVRSEDPDIVAFQEVRHDSERDSQVETLAKLLPGYMFAWAAAMSYPEQLWHRVEEGCAVFSRYPIDHVGCVKYNYRSWGDYLTFVVVVEITSRQKLLKFRAPTFRECAPVYIPPLCADPWQFWWTDFASFWRYELLPKNPEDNGDVHQRALLQVEISTHLGGFHALVTHLALSEMARDLSVLKIWLRIQQIQRDKDGATVALMGDLNAEPLETAMQFLVGNQTLVDPVTGSNITMTGMVDAWTSLHPNEDGHTFNMLDVSDPKKGLKKRIDYIIMKPWKRVQLGEVATIPRAFKPDDPPASDHLGVIMLLERK